ncbi:MAG: transporter substrate-binding domain-containing protein [Lachnospiraceae bacterium]|nr:transporter substrate-binding domain-containing protein [Lachnospiraceae bacterium]
MKKTAAICMTLAMVVSLSAGFTSLADDQTALDRVLERGKLIVATDAAWPPFEYMEGENVVGVDLDIAKDIADGLGVELEIINVSFDSLSMYLENGEADLALAAITVTEDRADAMEFSEPYCESSQYIVVKDDNDDVKSIDDLAGYTVGVHLGTTGDFLISDEVNMGVLAGSGASVQQYKDLTIAAMGLNAGDVQAVVCDKQLAENLCTVNDGLKCFEAVYADGSSTQEEYAAAAAKGETDLIAKVNEIIVPLKEDGTIDQYIVEESAKSSALNEEAEVSSEAGTEADTEAATEAVTE